MPGLGLDDFPRFFEAVHGYSPFPWQARLARQVVETGRWPSLLDLPTAAGKTAAIDVALFHLACEAGSGSSRRAPMRILFVIDRRIVVDSAAERANRIRDALRSVDKCSRYPVLAEMARRLSSYSGDEENPLYVVRLRGGVPRERDWVRSPGQPLVAVSTVDQVGSRLLFRGYGVSPRMWPVHAGLVGADALWLLDEVHLSHPLEQTLDAIARGHVEAGGGVLAKRPRLAPFAIVKLSATPGEEARGTFGLGHDDREHPRLEPRLVARKRTTIHSVNGDPAAAYAAHALRLAGLTERATPQQKRRRGKRSDEGISIDQALRLAVVVNRVDLARAIHGQLRKEAGERADVLLLTGRIRPLDRDRLLNHDKFRQLFTAENRDLPLRPIILCATQTVEAGADLDFDALITEIAPLDALRQRFGRLDRLGLRKASQAVILHPKGSAKTSEWAAIGRIYGGAAFATKTWLDQEETPIDFGIDGFAPKLKTLAAGRDEDTDRTRLSELIAIRANAPVLLPAYSDLWATTSPTPAATPEPELFLHGPRIERDVQVVWRADIDIAGEASAHRSLDLCPPSALEALPVPIWAARQWLLGKDASPADVVEQAPEADEGEHGSRRRCFSRPDGAWTSVDPEALRPGDLVVVPTAYGGCDEFGWNPKSDSEVSDLGVEAHYHQRLRGALRLSRAMLANALRREAREHEADDLWSYIRAAFPEDGEEAGAEEAASLCDALVGLGELLPVSWRTLLRSEDRRKGIAHRKPAIQSFGDRDWSRGCILYAEKVLDRGLLDRPSEDEPQGEEAITEREDSWRIGENVLLPCHLDRVEHTAREFAAAAGLDESMIRLVTLAARLHDIGKADPRFQADLHGQSSLLRLGLAGFEPAELLAKSGRGASSRSVRATPENFRHEALSVALAARHPALAELDEDDRDLVFWLIGTHHGYGRPFFPPCLDPQPTTVTELASDGTVLLARADAAPLRLDQGWFERATRLNRRFGPWELARLEGVLRLADHAASAEEQRLEPDHQGKTAAEAAT